MKAPFSNYLRTYRKRSGLTQQELSFLLGCESSQVISRYEHNVRTPNLQTVLALQIIFGVAADEMFPTIYTEIMATVQMRVHELTQNLSKLPETPRRQHKSKTLGDINNYKSNNKIL